MVRHINADGFRDVSRTMSVRREILKLFLKWKLKWVDKMTAGTVGKMLTCQMVTARLSNRYTCHCISLESSLPSAISGLGSEWPIPAELSRWCTNTGTAVYVTEMKLYLFVIVASTANLWCDKQKLIKKIVEQSRKKRKIKFSFRHDKFSKLSKRYSLLKNCTSISIW